MSTTSPRSVYIRGLVISDWCAPRLAVRRADGHIQHADEPERRVGADLGSGLPGLALLADLCAPAVKYEERPRRCTGRPERPAGRNARHGRPRGKSFNAIRAGSEDKIAICAYQVADMFVLRKMQSACIQNEGWWTSSSEVCRRGASNGAAMADKRHLKRSEEYRRHADEAEELAKKCRDPEARRTYEGIANQWRQMAAVAERHGR